MEVLLRNSKACFHVFSQGRKRSPLYLACLRLRTCFEDGFPKQQDFGGQSALLSDFRVCITHLGGSDSHLHQLSISCDVCFRNCGALEYFNVWEMVAIL